MKFKKINMKFRLCDTLNKYCYNISIYDSNNKLLYSGKTDISGCICYNFLYGAYKIIVHNYKLCLHDTCIVIYVNNTTSNELLFCFNSCNKKQRLITIHLKDQFYSGLPIEKGKVILWQGNIPSL